MSGAIALDIEAGTTSRQETATTTAEAAEADTRIGTKGMTGCGARRRPGTRSSPATGIATSAEDTTSREGPTVSNATRLEALARGVTAIALGAGQGTVLGDIAAKTAIGSSAGPVDAVTTNDQEPVGATPFVKADGLGMMRGNVIVKGTEAAMPVVVIRIEEGIATEGIAAAEGIATEGIATEMQIVDPIEFAKIRFPLTTRPKRLQRTANKTCHWRISALKSHRRRETKISLRTTVRLKPLRRKNERPIRTQKSRVNTKNIAHVQCC
mmetsp:Transcript_10990/g.26969  ORF Transcript_10990/g.26969 Transcript_10990/m.26969 type:complete len:268 (-) Transcript_10990:519-1322(-)